MWVLTFRLFPHKGEAVAEGDDLGWHNLATRIAAAVTARGYNSCSILAIIQFLNFVSNYPAHREQRFMMTLSFAQSTYRR
jgi:hypothetical protein